MTNKEKDFADQDYFSGQSHFYDKNSNMNVIKIISGDYYVSEQPNDVLITILGSCISACVRDPVAQVGGMNHFLLPGDNSNDSTRFGAYAMEKLINDILKAGGKKNRLELKLFGGANVMANSSARIGHKNIEFIREYTNNEGLNIVTADLGGFAPRRIHYYPSTGRVMMKKVQKDDNKKVIAEEQNYASKLRNESSSDGDAELF